MSDYDAAFAEAAGVKQGEQNPYDAIMVGLTPKVKPTQERPKVDVPGIGESMLIGAGRTFDRLGAGLQQLYYGARGDKNALNALDADQAEKARIFAGLQKERPLATGIGQSLPMMAVPIGGAGAGVAGLAGRAAIAGAVPEALSYGSAEERAKNAALSGAVAAVGAGAGYAAGRAVQGLGRGLTVDPQARAAANALEGAGIPVRPDQATGNRTLQNINAALDNLPWTAGKQQAFRQSQQDAFTNAAGKFIGQGGPLDDNARIAARNAISAGYTEVAGRNAIPPARMSLALDDINTIAKDSFSPKVQGWATNILDRVGKDGSLQGRAYKELDSKLGKAMRGEDAHYIGELRQALRRAMNDSIRPEDAGRWADLDSQYSALAAISKSVDEAGNVSPRKLFTNTRDKSIVRASRGELGELAKAGKTIIPDQVPNSGTAQRAMAQALLTGGGGAIGYLGSGGDVENAAYGAAGAFALPMLARAAVNSPQLVGLLAKPRFQAQLAAPIGGLLGAGAGLSAPNLLFPSAAQ